MSEMEHIEITAAAISRHLTRPPEWVIVLGSGLGDFADQIAVETVVPYSELEGFPVPGVPGHEGRLVLGHHQGRCLAVLQGRSHLYEGIDPRRIVFPLRVLQRLGPRFVVLTNAAGGMAPGMQPGDIMLIRDHINLTGVNPLWGPNLDLLGPRFPDMSDAYDPELVTLAAATARQAGISLHTGIYVAVAGPSYETPAEVAMLRRLGGDAVGMSTVPEVLAARHLGLRVLALSFISNLAAGLSDRKLTHAEVLAPASEARARLYRLILGTIERTLPQGPA